MKPTKGEISAVPCPHCGKANDCRGFRDMGIDIAGAIMTCDHCERKSRITGVGVDERGKPNGSVVDVMRVSLQSGKGNQTTGPMHAVKCPACQGPQDCTELHAQGLLNKGNTITCDRCNAVSRVMMIAPITILILTPTRA